VQGWVLRCFRWYGPARPGCLRTPPGPHGNIMGASREPPRSTSDSQSEVLRGGSLEAPEKFRWGRRDGRVQVGREKRPEARRLQDRAGSGRGANARSRRRCSVAGVRRAVGGKDRARKYPILDRVERAAERNGRSPMSSVLADTAKRRKRATGRGRCDESGHPGGSPAFPDGLWPESYSAGISDGYAKLASGSGLPFRVGIGYLVSSVRAFRPSGQPPHVGVTYTLTSSGIRTRNPLRHNGFQLLRTT
jgi:hypothetical protein